MNNKITKLLEILIMLITALIIALAITYFAIKVEKIIKEKIPSLNNITIEVNKK